ncbi:hypothetical protein ACKGJN_05710 [Gillisia sp. Q332]|uniref:hypothetical protein n=1 Tax=Gillisia xinjiangensis TaxID=3384765 RepID=UPI00391A91E7
MGYWEKNLMQTYLKGAGWKRAIFKSTAKFKFISVNRNLRMESQSLILIARPIDFLFALEVVKRFDNDFFLIFIYPNSHPQEKKAIDFLFKEFGKYFTNVEFIHFNTPFKNDFINLHFFNLWFYFNYGNRKIYLISTSGGVKGRIIYKYLKPRRLIFTDEGTSSFKKFTEIFNTARYFPHPNNTFYKLLYKTLRVYDLKNFGQLEIFTLFDSLTNLEGKVEITNLKNWRNILKLRDFGINTKEIIILGSVPSSINMDYSIYKKKIEKIYAENRGLQIWFKPHKNFPDNLGYPELKTELPIEYYLLERNSVPVILYSFGSTSNITLKKLFPEINVGNLL